MKVIKQGNPDWIGVYECNNCGSQISLEIGDYPQIEKFGTDLDGRGNGRLYLYQCPVCGHSSLSGVLFKPVKSEPGTMPVGVPYYGQLHPDIMHVLRNVWFEVPHGKLTNRTLRTIQSMERELRYGHGPDDAWGTESTSQWILEKEAGNQ